MLAQKTWCGTWITAAAIGLGVTAISAPIESAAIPPSDFSGKWILNRNLSDFPKEVGFGVDLPTDVARTGGGGSEGRGGGRGGGGAPVPNRIPRPQSEEDVAKADQLVEEVRNPSASLTIAQGAESVSLTNADGKTRTFHTNGRRDVQTLVAGPVVTTTKWNGAQLVIQYDVDQDHQLRCTYDQESDHSQLRMRSQLLLHGRGEVLTRVYER